MLVWLAGCVGPTMVEVPGGILPGPIEGAWPAEVPSLAGCTWTARSARDERETTWTYDRQGRLQLEETTVGIDTRVTTYTWRRGCLTGLEREPGRTSASSELGYTNPSEVHLYACDRYDNKVSWELAAPASDGSFVEIKSASFVNTYDAIGQLATVETWNSGSDGAVLGPDYIDTYTWNADAQPLVQVHESPLEGAKTTWTWWWDHDLLLGRDEEGTGADEYMQRTYEDRRLTDEVVDSDSEGQQSISWIYDDPPGRFPITQVSNDAAGVVEHHIDVSCEE